MLKELCWAVGASFVSCVDLHDILADKAGKMMKPACENLVYSTGLEPGDEL